MFEICIRIHGKVHCFPIPVLINDPLHLHGPDPRNYPVLDLAATILELSETVKVSASREDMEFVNQVVEASRGFVKNVQAGLPEGVNLNERARG
ncbi:MAG: hypothetical protein WBW04_06880 [Nitrolancea sp.]